MLKEQTGLLFLEFNGAKNILTFKKIQNSVTYSPFKAVMQLHATVWCGRHYEAEKMMFPLKYDFPDLQDRQKSGGHSQKFW